MIRSIKIKNFRFLRSLSLNYISRINLLTGINGAGKTTLLEAIFLNCGANNAALAGSVTQFRDDFEISPFSDRLFRGLFSDLDVEKKVLIDITGDPRKKYPKAKRSLQISPVFGSIGETSSTTEPLPVKGVEFNFKGPSGKSHAAFIWESFENIIIPGGQSRSGAKLSRSGNLSNDLLQANLITPYFRGIWNQTHDQLTELVKKRKVSDVIKQLKFIKPDIQDLVPLAEDNVKVIYADLGGDTLLPASLLGAGFFNVLQILLTAANSKNAVILIDEIEDGLHFSIVPDLIKMIFKISKKNNIQFFISTHSDEILSYFSELSRKTKFTDISVYRLGRRNNEAICTRFSRKEFLQASEIGAEIR